MVEGSGGVADAGVGAGVEERAAVVENDRSRRIRCSESLSGAQEEEAEEDRSRGRALAATAAPEEEGRVFLDSRCQAAPLRSHQ